MCESNEEPLCARREFHHIREYYVVRFGFRYLFFVSNDTKVEFSAAFCCQSVILASVCRNCAETVFLKTQMDFQDRKTLYGRDSTKGVLCELLKDPTAL